MIPQEVRDLAAGIADDIERNGHWQGEGVHWTPAYPDAPCCLVDSPSFRRHQDGPDRVVIEGFWSALRMGPGTAFSWNDDTPTAEVLATLRQIAAGETP